MMRPQSAMTAFALMLSMAAGPVVAAAPDYAPPPGALNPNVAQSNIRTTICVRGWTKTVRPPLAYTATLKREQMRERRLPRDPRNLGPEPLGQAKRKDRWELRLNRAVCAGRMTLAAAQHKIADPALWR